jgi:hypothetical protein
LFETADDEGDSLRRAFELRFGDRLGGGLLAELAAPLPDQRTGISPFRFEEGFRGIPQDLICIRAVRFFI